MLLGEVYERLDVKTHRPLVVVLSGSMFNSAGTGRVIVCPAFTTDSQADFASVITFRFDNADYFVVPDLLHSVPVVALGESPIMNLSERDVDLLKRVVRSIFD